MTVTIARLGGIRKLEIILWKSRGRRALQIRRLEGNMRGSGFRGRRSGSSRRKKDGFQKMQERKVGEGIWSSFRTIGG